MLRATILASIACMLAVLVAVAQFASSPYSMVLPGGVYELGPKIHLPPDRQKDSGWLAFTAVRVRKASYADWLTSRLDPTARLVPTSELRPEGMPERDYVAVRARWMEASKATATVVALRRAGYPVEVTGRGVLVERVQAGAPADGKLQVGDVILRLDGRPVDDAARFGEQLRGRPVGDELKLDLLRGQEHVAVHLTTAASTVEAGRPLVGIRTSSYVFEVASPLAIRVETENVVGPSAGLMFSLALFDALTVGDLAGGHRVAGSGTIGLEGRVGPIGSVAEKVVAAEREQAGVFLTPRENAAEAARAARGTRVIGVGTFDEALSALQELGGQAGRSEAQQADGGT